MLKASIQLVRTILLALILAACGGDDRATLPPPEPGTVDVMIALATNPDPPKSGQVELTAILTDAAGRPIDNANVNFLGSHKTMSGMNMQGAATAQGNGRYAISADFGMNGPWLVTVEVRGVNADVTRKDFTLTLE